MHYLLAALCSLAPGPHPPSASATILLATALPDTIETGAGDVTRGREPGHSGMGVRERVYGQVVDVARFAGADSALLARTFMRRGSTRAIVVPWDYGPSCDPVRWEGSFAWVTPAQPGTYVLRLRADSLWRNGMPVFDAFMAALKPYPLYFVRRDSDMANPTIGTTRLLTAAEYFQLLAGVPTAEELRATPDSAWVRFLRWQRAHPELSRLQPANVMAENIASVTGYVKVWRALRSFKPVIAGTYRMTATLDGGPEREFFLRTSEFAFDEWHPAGTSPVRADPGATVTRPSAYDVLATGAADVRALPDSCGLGLGPPRDGYMYAIEPPDTAGEQRSEWRGWIEFGLVTRQFPADSALNEFGRIAGSEWGARWKTATTLEAPARFWRDENGVLHVEQITRVADGRTLVIRGERISTHVVGCKW